MQNKDDSLERMNNSELHFLSTRYFSPEFELQAREGAIRSHHVMLYFQRVFGISVPNLFQYLHRNCYLRSNCYLPWKIRRISLAASSEIEIASLVKSQIEV